MAVRFIIGRAGTGKTHHCLKAIRTRLREDPMDGPRLILLVPEQASLQMERAMLQAPGVGAAHRAEVVSFRRLARRVLEWSGAGVRRAISEPARAMVIRHLLARRAGELKYYGRMAGRSRSAGRLGGFVERLTATIAELFQEAIEPEDLTAAADKMRGADPAQRAKLSDLQLIYASYLAYLGSERLDPSCFLQVACARLPMCPWFEGAHVWVDGFASLAGQETLTLVALARKCQHVDITVMMDPALAQAAPATIPARLFSRTRETWHKLVRAFLAGGVEVQSPALMTADPPPRFAANTPLAGLERTLFAPKQRAAVRAQGEAAARPPSTALALVELPSRRLEVRHAVARVCEWVQDPTRRVRYRDVALIVRDLEPYHHLLTEALDACGIPFFIDRRRPIAHHALVELLRAAVAMASDDLSLESVRLALKTGLLPISVDAADALENYLIAQGLSGAEAWRGPDWTLPDRVVLAASTTDEPNARQIRTLARINQTRNAFLACMAPWLDRAGADQVLTGSAWSKATIQWLDHLAVARTLEGWADGAERDGDLDQAEQHRQIWRDTVSFLDDLAYALAGVTLSAEDRAGVLEAGLSGLTLGLAPPMIDQVLVGSIDRSRHPDIKAAVMLGFNDGIFPKALSEDSILSDDDRDALRSAGVRIAPPARERILDEALLLYTAVTRASETLVITYASADHDGAPLRVSPYIDALQEAVPGLTPSVVGDPVAQRDTWDILCPADLVERLVAEFRTRPTVNEDNPTTRARFNELYASVQASLTPEDVARRVLGAMADPREARLSPALAQRVMASPLKTSVSRLETYAACPFQYFARYQLGLRARPEASLEAVDVGKVHHAVLEDFIDQHRSGSHGLANLSEDELLTGLGESCARVATRIPPGGAVSDARSAYLLHRSSAYLTRALRAQQAVAKAGAYRPRAAELAFGFDRPGSLPALALSTPAGRRVFLRGYIDRVDLAELGDELLGVVIDYKRTRDKRLDLSEVYHGLSLQLLAYLLVLAEHGKSLAGRPIKPGGALYVSLAAKYEPVDHPDLISPRAHALPGAYRPRGVVAADRYDALEASSAGATWSPYFAMYRKADGSFGQTDRSDVADGPSFRAMLDHTSARLGALADGMLDGDVAVRPYRLGTFSPCAWCPVSSVCRFELGLSDVRFLEKLTRSEVFRRLTGGAVDE